MKTLNISLVKNIAKILMRQWFRVLQQYPGVTFVSAGIILAIPFAIYDFTNGINFKDFSINLQSAIIDVFFLGILVVIYNKLRSRKETVERLRDEIYVFLPWKAPEATYRIVGLIKTLNKLGESEILLPGAQLQKADLYGVNLQGADLSGANLKGANLALADLRFANLQGANLQGAILKEAIMWRTNFRKAILRDTDMEEASLQGAYLQDAELQGVLLDKTNLRGTKLNGAYVESPNWLLELKGKVETNFVETQRKYKVGGPYSKSSSKSVTYVFPTVKYDLEKLYEVSTTYENEKEVFRLKLKDPVK